MDAVSVDLKTPTGPTAPEPGEFVYEYEVNPPPDPLDVACSAFAIMLMVALIAWLAYLAVLAGVEIYELLQSVGAQ